MTACVEIPQKIKHIIYIIGREFRFDKDDFFCARNQKKTFIKALVFTWILNFQ